MPHLRLKELQSALIIKYTLPFSNSYEIFDYEMDSWTISSFACETATTFVHISRTGPYVSVGQFWTPFKIAVTFLGGVICTIAALRLRIILFHSLQTQSNFQHK
jgi:hypothetical protein